MNFSFLIVGYRVKSLRGTQFRIWARAVLKEYMTKGFAMNDDLMKRAGGGNYFQELLARIRDIRSSEKVFCRQWKAFMGMTSFKGKHPQKADIISAKNYLTEEELSILNRLVSVYLEFAERQMSSLKLRSIFWTALIRRRKNFRKETVKKTLLNAEAKNGCLI